eukprot:447111-Hanusia_phi.AAC.1
MGAGQGWRREGTGGRPWRIRGQLTLLFCYSLCCRTVPFRDLNRQQRQICARGGGSSVRMEPERVTPSGGKGDKSAEAFFAYYKR